MKYWTTILLMIMSVGLTCAQEVQPTLADTLEAEDEAIMEALLEQTDSMSSAAQAALIAYEQTDLDKRLIDWRLEWLDTTSCTMEHDETALPDSVYAYRLSMLPTEIAMPYNHVVRSCIERYVLKWPKQMASLRRLADYYYPIFEDKLCEYGLPEELKHLAVIESALNPSIRSRAGAAGLWQFMPSTAKVYGLEVNSLVDERQDVYKSTDAACRYLRALYRVFEDWHLALAAYNCGPGNVNKAIRRSGGKRNFWDIYPYLPSETRGYVPIFIAANYALSYAEEHGICTEPLMEGFKLTQKGYLMPVVTDTLQTSSRLHLMQISETLGISMDELRRLNPAYIRDILPGGKNYTLVLPVELTGAYLEHEEEILAYKADSLIHQQKAVIEAAQKIGQDGSYSSGGVTYYTVKKGDTLGAIAKRYHCSVSQLKRWNNLKSDSLQIKQRLKILK